MIWFSPEISYNVLIGRIKKYLYGDKGYPEWRDRICDTNSITVGDEVVDTGYLSTGRVVEISKDSFSVFDYNTKKNRRYNNNCIGKFIKKLNPRRNDGH